MTIEQTSGSGGSQPDYGLIFCVVKQETPSAPKFPFIDWTSADDGFESERYEALSSFMLVALVCHCGMLLGLESRLGNLATTVFFPAFCLSALVGLCSPRAKRHCLVASFGITSCWLFVATPHFANHLLLEWSVLLFLIVCRNEPDLALKALRWLIFIVLFHSGFQKLVIGQYFAGEFLAYNTATLANFTDFMGLFLSEGEFTRITAMAGRSGTGPYGVNDILFVAMSNAVWIGEMGIAILLIVPSTRRVAVFAAFALIASIELGAREAIFGFLFTSLILAFYPGRNGLALWPGLATLQLAAMLAFHFLPALRLN